MYTVREIIWKVCKTLHRKKFIIANWSEHYEEYCCKYKSYGHYIDRRKASERGGGGYTNYFAARPNPGAGIGHQMANWIAGYWYAKQFGLNFAHIPFSGQKAPFVANEWDEFLGFGNDEVSVKSLLKKGYTIVLLPLFEEQEQYQVDIIRGIIESYSNKKVVFLAEQDQFYKDQFGVMEDIQRKFYRAPARANDKLIYKDGAFNIAIHVRRGDIMLDQSNPNLSMRYQDNDYFVNALKTALEVLKDQSNIQIYLFSQGKEEDYSEFTIFGNMHFCLDMGARESFLHMVYADALITSKSSFSYKPALLNKGIKFCPANFWHGYPDCEDWILLDQDGGI